MPKIRSPWRPPDAAERRAEAAPGGRSNAPRMVEPRAAADDAVVAAARDQGVGVYPLSSLYAATPGKRPDRPAGLVLGYASLAVEPIREGIRRLGRALAVPA